MRLQSYVYWCRQYILFHNKRHPRDLGKSEMEDFLNYLVTNRRLSASSQSQALNALMFVGEPKSLSSELLLEHTAFLDEIIEDHLLLAVKPAGQRNDEEVEGLYDRGHCPNRLAAILPDNNIIRLV